MAMTRIHSIEADYEVQGVTRRVRICADDQTLMILGISYEESFELMQKLSTGTLLGVRPPEGGFKAESVKEVFSKTVSTVAGGASTGETSKTAQILDAATRLGEKVTPEKPVHVPGANPAIPAKITRAEAKEAGVATKEEPPAVEKQAAQSAASTPSEAQRVAEEPGSIPTEIKNAKRFIQVVEWVLKTKGLKPSQIDEVERELSYLKEEIAVVRRVGNMREKLEANLAAFAEEGNA